MQRETEPVLRQSELAGRRLHRYTMRWEGTDREVPVILAVDVEDLEQENTRLRQEKRDMRSLLDRAQRLFRPAKDEQGGDPEWVAAVKHEVREVLRRG